MKIARAQKEISRLSGEIQDIKHRLQNCLSTIEGNAYNEFFSDLYPLYTDRLNKLIRLKDAVHKVNVKFDMHKYIVMLGELKESLVFFKELNPKVGKHERSYGDNLEVYTSQITVSQKTEATQKIQEEINRIRDLLDDFNANTDIGEIEEIVLPLPDITKRKL